jgi:hypothetical protein
VTDEAEIAALLERAREGAEARETWRKTGPTLARLHELGVSYTRIKEATGLSASTVAHHVRYPTGPSSRSTAGP